VALPGVSAASARVDERRAGVQQMLAVVHPVATFSY
jgi:hypothetical protein